MFVVLFWDSCTLLTSLSDASLEDYLYLPYLSWNHKFLFLPHFRLALLCCQACPLHPSCDDSAAIYKRITDTSHVAICHYWRCEKLIRMTGVCRIWRKPDRQYPKFSNISCCECLYCLPSWVHASSNSHLILYTSNEIFDFSWAYEWKNLSNAFYLHESSTPIVILHHIVGFARALYRG